MKCSFLDYIQLLMIGQAIRAKNIDRNTKKQKRPPKTSKNKMFIFGYIQLLMIGRVIQAKNIDQNTKKQKGPLSYQKIKCSFLDYVQLLMIGQAIRVTNSDWNAKKVLLSHQKIRCSFSDGLPEDCQKCTRSLWLSSGSLLTLWYKEISIKDYTSTWIAVP